MSEKCVVVEEVSCMEDRLTSLHQQLDQGAAAHALLEKDKAVLEQQLGEREVAVQELESRLEEGRIRREELEESLLDTQELVTCMEHKLEEAHKLHRYLL